ncbi:MAG: HAD hydrolase-like protein [Elusimicrobia bacterium]|nr:HAD hydrolase-like protein [Elusimicrobiota bacterium]
MKAKLLVFDIDGTLLVTGGAGIRAFNKMFKIHFGIEEAIKGVDPRGKTDPVIFAEIVRTKLKRKPKPGEVKRIMELFPRYLKAELRHSPGYRLLGGIKDFLKIVSKLPNVYLALGTGNLETSAYYKLAPGGLGRYFPVGGFATDSIIRPVLLRKGAQKAGRYYGRRFLKKDIFIIGDTPLDVFAAKACGFRSVAVDCGMGNVPKLKAVKPEFFFKDFSNPQEWIDKLGLRAMPVT